MFAFKEEFPVGDVASLTTADIAVPFYQPIVDRDRQIIALRRWPRRWEPRQQRYQGIDFPSLSDDESLHVDIVMLRAILA